MSPPRTAENPSRFRKAKEAEKTKLSTRMQQLNDAMEKLDILRIRYKKDENSEKDNAAAAAYYAFQSQEAEITAMIGGYLSDDLIKRVMDTKINIPKLIKADFNNITDANLQPEDLPQKEDLEEAEYNRHLEVLRKLDWKTLHYEDKKKVDRFRWLDEDEALKKKDRKAWIENHWNEDWSPEQKKYEDPERYAREEEPIPIPAIHQESASSAPEPLPPPIETKVAPAVSAPKLHIKANKPAKLTVDQDD
jgi:hypothetical protein